MTRVAPNVPDETDLLCEFCGYTLNGLPEDSNCPECGHAIRESIGTRRVIPAWEHAGGMTFGNFLRLTAQILFRPTHFYKTLATRREVRPASMFANIHWMMVALLFGAAAWLHANFFLSLGVGRSRRDLWAVGLLCLIVPAYVGLRLTTWIAARLTNWEATYRGIRLPLNVVLRGMYYHAAHYLPVAVLALLTVAGYQLFDKLQVVAAQWATTYLYVLCGEVVVCAGYLFNTYWIGMRNMMYANR